MVTYLKHWLPAIVFASLIFGLSAMSSPPGTDLAPDYLGHSIEYGLFAMTLLWGLTAGGCKSVTLFRGLGAWFMALAFAITDEFHQSFVPNRYPSWHDVLADAVGAALFITVMVVVLRWRCAAVARLSE
ncbi:MAG: hypothetical protein EHM61_27455 [Acidobacteria bacterium]|nr:MAG: hypothetical protein EHM61_27455 [Acidobacteriota bacterium]